MLVHYKQSRPFIWVGKAARIGVTAQVTFMSIRGMMEVASLEATVNPDGCLLGKYYEALGTRKVEQFIRNVAFSIESGLSPAPMTNKRRKLNINVPDYSGGQVQPQMQNVNYSRNAQGRGFGGPARRPGRGGYNKNYRTSPDQRQQGYMAEQYRVNNNSDHRGQDFPRDHEQRRPNNSMQSPPRMQRGMPMELIEQTPPSVNNNFASSVVIKPWTSPIKGRVLDWADL
jgi:hypothetical protein